MQVVDLMTTEVITVRPDTAIKEAARTMFRNRVSGLPVIDDHNRLVGMITEADFLALEVERFDEDNGGPVAYASREIVSQVMNRGVITTGPEIPLMEAAKVMATQQVKRLPVVDDDGRLLGIISRLDVVALWTRPDEIIEDEIREDLIRRVMFVDPETIKVKVEEGVVTLEGELGTRNEVRLIEELTRRLDGVMRVENRLGWRIDDVLD